MANTKNSIFIKCYYSFPLPWMLAHDIGIYLFSVFSLKINTSISGFMKGIQDSRLSGACVFRTSKIIRKYY